MRQRDLWQEMTKHLSEMKDAMDSAMRKMPPLRMFAGAECPPVNVYESDREVVVRAAVPGVPKESLSVNLKGGALIIEGGAQAVDLEDHTCTSKEYDVGEFSRAIVLPADVDHEAEISAVLDSGILTVRLPKLARETGRTIQVDVV